MIKQLSVFVENRPGSLMDVTSQLTEAHINIRAVSSFDAPEFGILRLIVDKPMEAKEYLTSKGFVVRVSEVLGAELEDKKGTLNNMRKERLTSIIFIRLLSGMDWRLSWCSIQMILTKRLKV